MQITVNNQNYQFQENPSVALLLEKIFPEGVQNGIAIAVNQTVVAKKDWPQQTISKSDKVMIIKATQGG